MSEPVLFSPGLEPLKRDYPLLREIDEFRTLTDKEMLFVWYYSCKSSPIIGIKEKERVVEAIKNVSEFSQGMKEGVYENYVDRNFPTHISLAIKRMKRFDPEIRHKAKIYTERILEYVNHVTTQDISKFEDVSDLKNFMSMQMDIAKNMPSIVAAAEHGYGFTKKSDKEDKKNLGILEED